nr:RNA-directed DNA polymerase, eukaryota, reverse transcriptase zinc-binding domain protein [Tanacetum cinerariifolium]
MAGKLKFLKNKIREWVKSKRCEIKALSDNLKEELRLVDDVIDLGSGNDEVQKRAEIVNSLRKIDHMQAMDMAQKTKLKWAIEGDENSSFFHGMLNKKRNQSNIRRIMVDGMWKDRPVDIKKEFLHHFRSRFGKPVERRATIDMSYPRSLSDEQRDEIEREVSKEEINAAVWDCCSDKSPGPDGFTFDFYRKFWSIIENDVYAAVNHFFNNGDIPAGCNASFIALIPKIPDANLVKDFRPISLIGSLRINMSKSKIMGVHVENVHQSRRSYVANLSVEGGCEEGSIPIFHMSMFRVPVKVFQVLESIRGRFFNGHEMGSNEASWVKWTNVLMDKKHGGLGVSSLYALNRSLMIKWIWRFFTQKESLWAEVISAIHWDYDKAESRCHAIGRSCWLSIVNEVRILKNKGMNIFDFMYLKVGNGDKVKFWTDHWFAGGIIKDICPRLFALENCKDISVSAKMNDNNLESSFRRKSRGGVEQVQMVSLVEAVSTINLVPMDDRWTWNLESSGEFSVASARKKINELLFPNIKDATR